MNSPIKKSVKASPDQNNFALLINKIATSQDKKAFIEVFQYFAPRVKAFLMRGSTVSEGRAEELMQDVMITVWQKAKQFDPSKAAVSTWIFTIARNKKIDARRKEKRFNVDPNDPLFVEISTSQTKAQDTHVQEEQEKVSICKAINSLPENQAEIIKQSFYESKSHQKIADDLGVPLGTVKSRMRLALEKLKGKLNKV